MDDELIREKIAHRLYELLVVNPSAIAIQQKDGRYATCYIQYDEYLLAEMLRRRGSAGCYQQNPGGLIKWICLDFDCKKKANPPLDELYNLIKTSVLKKLDEIGISYITEFSGRRGIHVWIIFEEKISKKIGYSIIQELVKDLSFDESKFGLDKFPATDSSSGNKVGKQVKFPLSVHRSGEQSFIFESFLDKSIVYESDFLKKQYLLLNSYKANHIEEVCKKLELCISDNEPFKQKYKRYKILDDIEVTVSEIKDILSEISIYKQIFNRLKDGKPKAEDWYVLLGTLSPIDISGDLLNIIFSESKSYDEQKTSDNIAKWKNKYFPATLSYLEELYGLSIEINYDKNKTGLEYLVDKLNSTRDKKIVLGELEKQTWKKAEYNSVNNIVKKETKYLIENDENTVIPVWNKMNAFSNYECSEIETKIQNIKQGIDAEDILHPFYAFERIENDERIRKLLVLSPYDRVLTTSLALQLAKDLNKGAPKAFSYNPAFLSKSDIFYPWFSSWSRYINRIRPYIFTPFLDDWGVFVIDVKRFYDNIDFLAVYAFFKDQLSEEDNNIFSFLINYNEILSRQVNGTRIGVPQGPAYARIISELFMNKILDKFYDNKNQYVLLRYVDDITVFYKPEYNGENLFINICKTLKRNGLQTNDEKTRFYGKIKELSEEERKEILRYGKFNYEFRNSDFNLQKNDLEKYHIFDKFIDDESVSNFTSIIFSDSTNEFYRYRYFHKYKKIIFETTQGRGSIFAKFYHYIFSNSKYLIESLNNNCFELIKQNTISLNFKNCISQLYLSVQNKSIDRDLFLKLCNVFIEKININEIAEEERSVVNALLLYKTNENY